MLATSFSTTTVTTPHPRYAILGGTGTFGYAFARRVLEQEEDATVVIFSRDELKQAQMKAAFEDYLPRMRFFIGDVADEVRVRQALEGVEVCIHAAAMKRIESCEQNPAEAVKTNVLGAVAVSRACVYAGVQTAVFLSTDKAAAPNTLYGATKLCAERLWLQANVYSPEGTVFVATRYGNVLGSRGSVVELWDRQVAQGLVPTITDPDMTRFWMTLDRAVDLVELAIIEAIGGEVYVPYIRASSVHDLLSALHGSPNWVPIGIRPGEKMHECLVTEDEARRAYWCEGWDWDYLVIEPPSTPWTNSPRPEPSGEKVTGAYTSDKTKGYTQDELRTLARGER